MRWNDLAEDSCPVARALAVIGDRWTLLILRDCFLGVRRFEGFSERLGVTRHVLADRLRKLEAAGVLRRERYQDRPPRFEYRLTGKGEALHSVLVTLIDWAEKHAPAPEPSIRLVSRETGEPVAPALIDMKSGALITTRNVRAVTAGRSGAPD